MDACCTSFADALAVPQLAKACCDIVLQKHEPGVTGLKVLREVSKEISVSMLAHIRGYALRLEDANQQHSLKIFKLLRHTRLSRLCVQVEAETGEILKQIRQNWWFNV